MRQLLLVSSVLVLSACQCGGTPPDQEVLGPVALSTPSLPNATVGIRYGATLSATGGKTPYAFTVTQGSLPPGLALATSGELAGVPLTAGAYAFTVEVEDAGSTTASLAYTMEVAGGALALVTSGLPAGEVGTPYTVELVASGGAPPYVWNLTAGELPAGLTLTAGGILSGTPLLAGAASFTVEVVDSAPTPASVGASWSLSIDGSTGAGAALRVTTSTLPMGTLGAAYAAQLQSSGGTAPVSWAIAAGSSLPPGMTLSTAGVVSGIPAASGTFQVTVLAVDSSAPQQAATATLPLVVSGTTGAALGVATPQLPSGTVGVAYQQQLAAVGGTAPYTWSVSSGGLPWGLTLSPTGMLSGTPDTSGAFTFNVQVKDSAPSPQVAQATFTVSVHWNPSQVVTITTGALPLGTVNGEYLTQLLAAGGNEPYAWTLVAGQLPNGLSVCGVGCLSGTPTAPGAFVFTVEVKDSSTPAHSARKQFTLTVVTPSSETLGITTPTLPNGTVGVPYNQLVNVSGGTAPYTFSLVAGGIPSGVLLGNTGGLSGTPTAPGNFNFTLRVTDSATPANVAHRTFSVTMGL